MKKQRTIQNNIRTARIRRVRSRISGTAERPRAAVKRSSRHINVQLIDDAAGRTMVAVSDTDVKATKQQTKTDIARLVGQLAAERATAAGISQIVFDRRWYAYHGRVRALAEGMREKGLSF